MLKDKPILVFKLCFSKAYTSYNSALVYWYFRKAELLQSVFVSAISTSCEKKHFLVRQFIHTGEQVAIRGKHICIVRGCKASRNRNSINFVITIAGERVDFSRDTVFKWHFNIIIIISDTVNYHREFFCKRNFLSQRKCNYKLIYY